jgi:2-phosphosulfolactate phosphatase
VPDSARPVRWHVIEGAEGCRFARERGLVAVVVDALRASATAAALLDAGAGSLLLVREVEEARGARRLWPDALLYGERGGLPPGGFDGGNSPRNLPDVRGRRVVFTTTTGAGRVIEAWGATAVYMGTTLNAAATARAAALHGTDVVVIPAGLATDPAFDAQEDWVAAAVIVRAGRGVLGEGAGRVSEWLDRIDADGTEALFHAAPHADKLRKVGLDADISYCARTDVLATVPVAVSRDDLGVWCGKAEAPPCW